MWTFRVQGVHSSRSAFQFVVLSSLFQGAEARLIARISFDAEHRTLNLEPELGTGTVNF
jgi:hypothetical protein